MAKGIVAGDVFGRWSTLTEYAGSKKVKRGWICRCECGTERPVDVYSLRDGKTKSCGCLESELKGARFRKHGGYESTEYSTWVHMTQRCYNPRNDYYPIYGGRGISVCAEWRNDFAAFLDYVGPKPTPRHSLDRFPNQNGNYEPGNVRWATPEQQNRNLRSNVWITHNGETKCLQDFSILSGLNSATIRTRLKLGWSIERALTQPARNKRRSR